MYYQAHIVQRKYSQIIVFDAMHLRHFDPTKIIHIQNYISYIDVSIIISMNRKAKSIINSTQLYIVYSIVLLLRINKWVRSVHFTLACETMNLIHRCSEFQSERNAYRLFNLTMKFYSIFNLVALAPGITENTEEESNVLYSMNECCSKFGIQNKQWIWKTENMRVW